MAKISRPAEGMARAILKVGDGRGFLVGDDRRYVVTAAHCLPHFPPCISFSSDSERTYRDIIGLLGQEQTIWAQCIFCDPISDLAVLGAPDWETYPRQADAYKVLVDGCEPLRVGAIPLTENPGAPILTDLWLLHFDGSWLRCPSSTLGECIWTTNPGKGSLAGLSGSPLLTLDGAAVGVFVTGGDDEDGDGASADTHLDFPEDGPQPILTNNLPAGLCRALWPVDKARS